LKDAAGDEVWSFSYNDGEGWPQEADGEGRSLVNKAPGSDGNLSDPGSWVASSQIGGSPGAAEGGEPPAAEGFAAWRKLRFPPPFGNDEIAGPLADPDRDRLANLFEYAFGSDPLTSSSPPITVLKTPTHLEIRYPRQQDATDVVIMPEAASDLSEWTSDGFTISADGGEAIASRPLVEGASVGQFVRLRVSLKP
jgi:hypothetical protein